VFELYPGSIGAEKKKEEKIKKRTWVLGKNKTKQTGKNRKNNRFTWVENLSSKPFRTSKKKRNPIRVTEVVNEKKGTG